MTLFSLGNVDILTILSFPIYEYGVFLYLFGSPVNFPWPYFVGSVYKSCTFFIKFIHKYFMFFNSIIHGIKIFFQLLLLYRNMTDFYILA